MFKSPTAQKALRIATIGGSSILVFAGVYQAFQFKKANGLSSLVMPGIMILVGATAFTHAMVVPDVDAFVVVPPVVPVT